ncbi:MAG: hypothetical protein ACRDK0_08925, partial [Solirubrobacteraceae bacterium]
MTIIRTLAAALAVAALAVPAAHAKPADMNPSVAQAGSQVQEKQDLRSADARDAALHPRRPADAVNAPGATAVDSATRPGQPQPITQAPAAKVTDGGTGIDWTTIGLGVAGSLLAVSGLAALN